MNRIEILKQMVEMRKWPEDQQHVRTTLLAVYAVDLFKTALEYKVWFELPRPDLDGLSLGDLIKQGKWSVVADFIDDALTGSPS